MGAACPALNRGHLKHLRLQAYGLPLHRLVSGRVLLLAYTGRKTGRHCIVPIGYFTWNHSEVLSMSTRPTWAANLRGGQPVRLRIQGRWHTATPTVVEHREPVAELLGEVARRKRPQTVAAMRIARLPERPGSCGPLGL